MGRSNQNLNIINFNELQCEKDNSGTYILENKFEGTLPLIDLEINFEDDIWDFKIVYLGTNSKFDFNDIAYNFKKYIKLYVFEGIINNDTITTMKKNYSVLKYICNFLNENYIYSPETITQNVVNKMNKSILLKYKSEGERIRARRLMVYLLKKIESDTGCDYKYLKEILEKENNPQLRKAQMESGKTKNINTNIFNKIIEVALRELEDDNINDYEKIQSCAILIISQTGIRISDLLTLEAGKIRCVKSLDGENNLKYLSFFSHKIIKGYTETFITDICEKAFLKLEDLTVNLREAFSTSYLFVGNNEKLISVKTLENYLKKFIIRNSKEIGVLNKIFEGNFIYTTKINKVEKLIPNGKYEFLGKEYKISIPKAHQYRVAVCNELLNKGVDLKWVQKHMGHLTTEMTLHYTRSKQEEKNNVIEGVIRGEFKLIGKEAEILTLKIEEFIKDNKYNIKTDLQEIVNNLSKKIPIRAKKNGYCIKSAFGKKCKYNEFMCAFDVCPNHCTSYLFADISYKRFKEGLKVIEYNKKNGFHKEAIMENNKLIRLVDDYLINELVELSRELENIGLDKVVGNNSNLQYLALNIQSVIKEVKLWKEKN